MCVCNSVCVTVCVTHVTVCVCNSVCNSVCVTVCVTVCVICVQMFKAAEMLGMSASSIMPVRNYWSELDLDSDTDVLLLSAVDLIQQYADLRT